MTRAAAVLAAASPNRPLPVHKLTDLLIAMCEDTLESALADGRTEVAASVRRTLVVLREEQAGNQR